MLIYVLRFTFYVSRVIYLDNNATTRVAPEVMEAMLPYLTERWGNPSSGYLFGHELAGALETARSQVAALLNADPREVIFTSCGTEGINAAMHSALHTQPGKRHVLTTAVEHSASLKYSAFLQKQGCEITFLPISVTGALDLKLLEKSIRPDTALVSVMSANNETGVLFPVAEIASICRDKGVLCHTDAVQMAGKLNLDVKQLGVDFLTISGHKFHSPKGIGALYVKRQTKYQPLVIGGGQERGRRGGTENVAYIVGLGRAAELALNNLSSYTTRVRGLRDTLEAGILAGIEGTQVNGGHEPRLPNTSNIAFQGVEAEGILLLLDQAGICASSGSACTAGSLDPSHVLVAMGCSAAHSRSSVRFSVGIYSSEADVQQALKHLPGIVGKLRAQAGTIAIQR
jgi:cysteine desulfurase